MLPIPTGLHSALSESPGVAAPSSPAPVEEEPPPPDATQPLDAATLAAIMGGHQGVPGSAAHPSQRLTEQALPFIAPPPAKAPPA
ncbi:hypothetical protein ACLESO_42555, partial [Pyxidicoccus sp. 3LG]